MLNLYIDNLLEYVHAKETTKIWKWEGGERHILRNCQVKKQLFCR